MRPFDLTVIIPTFNEEENISAIIGSVNSILEGAGINGEILVVDDSSSDKTISIVNKIAEGNPSVRLVVRTEDHGLSQSVVEGFSNAKSDVFQVIDADFSHPPELIPQFYESISKEGFDVVVGSRYLPEGDIQNWPLKRRVISLGATFLGRLLFPEITDPVSGFFAIRRNVVEDTSLKPRGYKVLMEVLGRGTWQKAKEVPFTFKDREEGESKLRLNTISDYLVQCLGIAWFALFHHNSNVWKEWIKIFKFGLVGISGIFVNIGILYGLTEYAGLYYLYSSLIAIEISIITNFILNDLWTFGAEKKKALYNTLQRFFSYQGVSIIGLGINFSILFILTEYLNIYYIWSNIVGILVTFVWNFVINRNFTWKNKFAEY